MGLAALISCGSSGSGSDGGSTTQTGGAADGMGAGNASSGGSLALGGDFEGTGMMPGAGGASEKAIGGAGGTTSMPTEPSGPVTSVTPIAKGMACTSTAAKAQLGELDLFIMLDKSGSMADATAAGPTKWKVISDAIDSFVSDPKSAGIGAGIGFFGLLDAQGQKICTVADFAKPSVGIAPLNGNAPKISAAIAGITKLGGGTPTTQALTGAIDYAESWSTAHPTRKVIVVFATDGLPDGCNSDVPSAQAAAKAGLSGKPPISTYVIGVFGPADKASVPNLNSFAKSGGTGTAFIVDTAADTGAQFLNAMNQIREANRVACDFAVPAPAKGKSIDFSHVGVDYTPGAGAAQTLTWVSAAKACTNKGGWYYDSDAAPTKITLCPTTCSTVQADSSAALDIYLACGTTPPSGSGGSGSGGTGSGGTGTGGSGTGTAGTGTGMPQCLLVGQSCSGDGDCCSGNCGTVCQSIPK